MIQEPFSKYMNDSPLRLCRGSASRQVLYRDDSQHCSYTSTKLISVFPCVLWIVHILHAYRSTILMNTSLVTINVALYKRVYTGAANKICKTQLSRTQSGPCSIAKEEQKQISPNHIQALFAGSVLLSIIDGTVTSLFSYANYDQIIWTIPIYRAPV